MKTKTCIIGLVLIVTATATASPTTGPATAPATQPATPINKFCAIATEDKVDPKVTYVHNGRTIGFCCAECIDEFKKDPEKHMKGLK